MNEQLYPLRFRPIFKDYIWGGQRLAETLGKQTGPGVWAESWEVVDHDNGQSTVAAGPLKGKSLRDLMSERGAEILGKDAWHQVCSNSRPEHLRGRFPLLLKFLDANRVLSVQVHPDDAMGAQLSPPDLGKTEAWYVIDAEPAARIFAGLKSGVTPEQLAHAASNGTLDEVLHSFDAQKGDCVFIRAGTVHAIGAGLLICEIQQASDTTFRLFDWNRVGNDGQPRPLHIEQGIRATDFELGPVQPVRTGNAISDAEGAGALEKLVDCDKFTLRRVRTDKAMEIPAGQMTILAVVDGEATITGDPSDHSLGLGDSVLVPASVTGVQIRPLRQSTILTVNLA